MLAGVIATDAVSGWRSAHVPGAGGGRGGEVARRRGRQIDERHRPAAGELGQDAVPTIDRPPFGLDEAPPSIHGRRMADTSAVVRVACLVCALGATACLIGRAYLYGLGAAGEPGVTKAIELLAAEVRRSMQLVGARTVHDLEASLVTRRS